MSGSPRLPEIVWMKPARIVVLCIAAVSALGLALVVRAMGQGEPAAPAAAAPVEARPMAKILVAARDLEPGKRLTDGDLSWKDWPVDQLNPAFISDGSVPLPAAADKPYEPLGVEGLVNIPLLAGIVGAVLLSGVWKPGIQITVYHVDWELQNIVRDLLLLGIALASWLVTSRASRDANGFSWFPILEVGKLFAGIFITIIPAIAILKAGSNGALAMIIDAVSDNGQPVDWAYFWFTGVLSSFLDNAPTYLVFFNTAGGDAEALMGPMASTLLAISAGAVFMGANTYIGNAPNFMVKAIAEERGIAMPSFFGYMGWSVVFLVPIFVLVTFLFFL